MKNDKERLYKPINVLFEIAILAIYIAVSHYNNKIYSSDSNYIFSVCGLFIFLLGSITIRTVLSKQHERVYSSSLVIGFVFGCYIWGLFIQSEIHALNCSSDVECFAKFFFWTLPGGILFAFAALTISLCLAWLMRFMR